MSLTLTFPHRLPEVAQVIGEALLLLVDVEFLYVVDHLLLESVAVVVDIEAVEALHYLLSYLLGALWLVLLHLLEQRSNIV